MLCLGKKSAWPMRIAFDDNEIRIKGISCGNEHSLFLTNTGDVYACGNSEDGVIGINDKHNQYSPIHIQGLSHIESISCGTIHNLALDKEGSVYSWGSARGGQLGLSDQYISSQGSSIADLFNNIIQISAEEAHSVALENKGQV